MRRGMKLVAVVLSMNVKLMIAADTTETSWLRKIPFKDILSSRTHWTRPRSNLHAWQRMLAWILKWKLQKSYACSCSYIRYSCIELIVMPSFLFLSTTWWVFWSLIGTHFNFPRGLVGCSKLKLSPWCVFFFFSFMGKSGVILVYGT